MTTFESISSCPKENYDFWTQEARLALTIYRRDRHCHTTTPTINKHNKTAFRNKIKKRREQKYLDDDKKTS